MLRLYAFIDDINSLIFELYRLNIVHQGPDCDCGQACELGINGLSGCEEIYLEFEDHLKKKIVELARKECDITDFRVEEVPHGEETKASSGQATSDFSASY